MKKFIAAVFFFVTISSAYTQEKFKEVKSAQDVIDNNITVIGGTERIKKIKSETVTGTFKVEGFEGNFFVYRNDTISFSKAGGNMYGEEMLMLKSVTTKTNSWEYQMGSLREFDGGNLKEKQEDLITGSIRFILKFKKEGYSAELKGTDTLNGNLCYKILFSKAGNLLKTNYYDSKTFYVVRSEKPKGSVLEFYDQKEVNGIYRPFKIIQKSETEIIEEVKEYEFNKSIDASLLSKPSEK